MCCKHSTIIYFHSNQQTTLINPDSELVGPQRDVLSTVKNKSEFCDFCHKHSYYLIDRALIALRL